MRKTWAVKTAERACLLLVAVIAAPLVAAAQFPPQPPPPAPPKAQTAKPAAPKPVAPPKLRPPKPGEVEMVPIKCWWKTGTTEVRVGQRFMLTLTCGVIETKSLKVIANTNALDPGAVQLTPFDVAGGVRRDDILSPPWHYFQYEYQVRLLSEGFFGQDVMIPSLRVTYNIQSSTGGGAEGRDLTYQMPQLPMRIASLVPKSATDIRDVSNEGFDAIASRRFRASVASVTGGILVAFAAVLLVIAAARALGRVRRRRPVTNKPLAPVTVFGAVLRGLATVKASVMRDGWSPALVRRAQGLVRLAAAITLGRAVAQTTTAGHAAERDGQLAVRQGWVRRRRAIVSAATTSITIDRALAEPGGPIGRVRASLEVLRNAMQIFNTAAYGKPGELDTIALDRALGESLDAIKQLRFRSLLPFTGTQSPDAAVAGLASPSITGDRA
jgi:hypothetical protein